jgi:nicotinamidase/pyrazinamidase
MKALILVDLQNDFLPGGPMAVPGAEEVIPLANQLQGCFRLVVATQDWHPPNHGCFAANHPGRRVGEFIRLAKMLQVLQPVHCVQNTPGAQLAPNLLRTRINRIFRKGTDPAYDSYSAFFDLGHRQPTGLGTYLLERHVREVYLLGLATDQCIKFSALDAVGLGFKTFVIEDACRGLERRPGDVAAALKEMTAAGVTLVQSQALLTAPARLWKK